MSTKHHRNAITTFLSLMKLYKVVLIFMALQFFLSLGLFVSLTYAQPPIADDISNACRVTLFPIVCKTSLTESYVLSSYPRYLQIVDSAINATFENLHLTQSMVASILNMTGDAYRTLAAQNCDNFLQYSEYWTAMARKRALPSFWIKDARAWMSAALQYQYDCWAALKPVNTDAVFGAMSRLDYQTELSSNALTILLCYDVYGKDFASWEPPKTERDGFWEAAGKGISSAAGLRAGIPSNLMVNVTVCKYGGSGCLKTVQEAVDLAPLDVEDRRFVIYIKEGVYEETVRVPLRRKNVVFLGDGMGRTIITGSLQELGPPTYNTATVGVEGQGFMAKGITIQNTAGPDPHQAVAFRSDSDLSIIEDCEFLGNRETIYAHTLRQFYKSCRIEGNVDFIFGSAAAVFQDCQILIRPQLPLSPRNETDAIIDHGTIDLAIAAHGRTDLVLTSGFVFQNCSINGTSQFMRMYYSNPEAYNCFLGRPWKKYARTVFINCGIEDLISPAGWMPRDDSNFALKTLYFGEYGNTGPGSNLSERVRWSSVIPTEHVPTYFVDNFLKGNGSSSVK